MKSALRCGVAVALATIIASAGSLAAPKAVPQAVRHAAALKGQVLDVTGRLLVVQTPDDRTLHTVYLTMPVPRGVSPGVTVHVAGESRRGRFWSDLVEVLEGGPWPPPTTPKQTARAASTTPSTTSPQCSR